MPDRPLPERERSVHGLEVSRCGRAAISYAFDDEQAADGIGMSDHFRFCVFYRIVPAGGLIERREFDNDGAPRVAVCKRPNR